MSKESGSNKFNITEDYLSKYKPVDKKAFAEFITEKRNEYNEDNPEQLSTAKLGALLGIGSEMFRKIINQQKPTKKRDCIIAIGVALNLSVGEINEALSLYQYMPALDVENSRDLFIFDQIKDMQLKNKRITVEELNRRLVERNLPGLDIHNKRNRRVKNERKVFNAIVDSSLSIKEMKARTLIDIEHLYVDVNESLCNTYKPSGYVINGDMLLWDNKYNHYIHLKADTEGHRKAILFSVEGTKKKVISSKSYNSLDESGDYKPFFIEIEDMLATEQHKHLMILNDTKNYRSRTSARLFGDSVSVFTEQYNYTIPELNEYYVMVRTYDQYCLYVYERSAFMSWYLTTNQYLAYFGVEVPQPKETYNSLNDLEKHLTSSKKYSEKHLRYQMRINAFKRLMLEVDKLYEQLAKKEAFIQNAKELFDDSYALLLYLHLEEEYECRVFAKDDCFGEEIECLPEKEFDLPDGNKITISIDEIVRAFEFGLLNIEDICRVKSKYGSIEGVLISDKPAS